MASWKPIETPAALLLRTNCPYAVPVKFHNYNDSVRRVVGILRVPTMSSREILLQAKGDHTLIRSATAPYFYGSILLRALKSEIIVLLTYVYKNKCQSN